MATELQPFSFEALPGAPVGSPPVPVDLEGVRRAGYAAGIADGRAQAAAALAAPLAALAQLAHELAAARDAAVEELSPAASELAVQVAERIVCGAVEVRPELVIDVVRGALRTLSDRERVIALVNPEDLELVSAAAGDLAGQLGGIERIDVQADRRVARGGALVRTAEGEVDATIAAKLERVREVIAAELAAS